MTIAHLRKWLHATAIVWLALLTALPASGFDKLSPAQSWIYDRGHLANTRVGQTLRYAYEGVVPDSSDVSDYAELTIVKSHDEGRRDVELDFLSAERHLPLPPFHGYRGNPVIIAMLEHIAQSLGNETGGGALYFRNRIRDALASEAVGIESGTSEYAAKTIQTTKVSFQPFTADAFLESDSVFRNAQIEISFSDDVPGGLVAIGMQAQKDDRLFNRILTIE